MPRTHSTKRKRTRRGRPAKRARAAVAEKNPGSGDLAARKVIRGIRTDLGYEGDDVEPLSTRTKKSVTDSVINTYSTFAELIAEKKIRYKSGASRTSLTPPPSTEQVDTMTDKADAVEATQEPAKGQKGVASPLRVLHKIKGVTPSQYRELFKQMIGDSVINTYATFAELIAEKRGDTTKALRKRVEAQEDAPVDQSPIPRRGSPEAKTVAAQTRQQAKGEPKPSSGHEMFMGGKGVESRSARASRRRTPGLSDLKKATKLAKAFREVAKTGRKGTRMRDIKKKERGRFTKDLGDAFDPHENVVRPEETNEGIVELGKRIVGGAKRKYAELRRGLAFRGIYPSNPGLRSLRRKHQQMLKGVEKRKVQASHERLEQDERAGNQGPPAIKVVEDPKRNNGN